MVNKMISAFLVMIINGTSSLNQGARCGYKVSSWEQQENQIACRLPEILGRVPGLVHLLEIHLPV